MGFIDIFKKYKGDDKAKADNIEKQAKECKSALLDEKRIKRWNIFIEDVCNREYEDLSPTQKKAVLCFWYDAEVNNGGHCGYFDCYPEVNPNDLEEALRCVGNDEIAENFIAAVNTTDEDSNCWEKMDSRYYKFSPPLIDYIEQYVEDNRPNMFSIYPNLVRVYWGSAYDDARDHFNKIDISKLNGYNHIAIFLRWMMEKGLLSEEILKIYPVLSEEVRNSELDLRVFIKKTEEFHGCICEKHFNNEGRRFANYFYDFMKKTGYPACIDKYALKYFGQEKYCIPELKNEAYLFIPYDEEYYNGMAVYINGAWVKFQKKFFWHCIKKDMEMLEV